MFDGEFASLKAIEETDTIKVPKPIAVLHNGEGTTMLVMEHLELTNCSNQAALGTQLAR
jgi:fructosamine-3-kinase